VPEAITPWLAMFVSALTLIGLLGAGAMFAWRRVLWPAFKRGVTEAVEPLLGELHGIRVLAEQTAVDLANYQSAAADKTDIRSAEIDGKFGSVNSRLDALYIQRSRDTQKVVEAVQTVQDTVSPSANGDAT
jgi:hypothetical protein